MSTTDTTCTCPSGDGSLRWPCPTHPPTERDERLREAREWVSVAHDRLDEAHSPSFAASEADVALVVLDAEVTRLDAVVSAVRGLHEPKTRTISVPVFDQWDRPTQVQHGCSCGHYAYPCPTIRALDEAK